MSADRIRTQFASLFQSVTSVALTFKNYRQAATAFGEKLVLTMVQRNPITTAYHEQSGHSEDTFQSKYAMAHTDLRMMSRENVSNFHACSIAWHRILGLEQPLQSRPVDSHVMNTGTESTVEG